jgi:hypothetical protein
MALCIALCDLILFLALLSLLGQAWWCTSAIPAPSIQEGGDLEESLGYKARPCLKKKFFFKDVTGSCESSHLHSDLPSAQGLMAACGASCRSFTGLSSDLFWSCSGPRLLRFSILSWVSILTDVFRASFKTFVCLYLLFR